MNTALQSLPLLGGRLAYLNHPWKLGVRLLVASAVLVPPTNFLASQAQAELTYLQGFGLLLPGLFLTVFLNFFLMVWLTQSFENDLYKMGLGHLKERLAFSPLPLGIWIVLMNMMFQVLLAWLDGTIHPELASFSSRMEWLFASHWLHLMMIFPLLPAWATISGVVLYGLYLQQRLLNQHVQEVSISWQSFDQVEAVANQGIRLVMMLLVLTSWLALSLLLGRLPGYEMLDEGFTLAISVSVILMWVVVLPLVLPFFIPILRIHRRIVAFKHEEINRVASYLESRYGDEKPFTRTPGEAADAMVYISLIESRSDWPIAADLRRALLIGVVIPATWVFAAVIENTIYQ